MYKIGDKVIIKNLGWNGEIGEVKVFFRPKSGGLRGKMSINPFPEYRYGIKFKTLTGIDVYSSNYYSESDFLSIKELRKLKLERLNKIDNE